MIQGDLGGRSVFWGVTVSVIVQQNIRTIMCLIMIDGNPNTVNKYHITYQCTDKVILKAIRVTS